MRVGETTMAEQEKVLDSYDRGDSGEQQVRAAISHFKGREYFSLRAWYKDGEERKPSKNGINLPVDEWPQFKELVDSLDAMLNKGEEG